MEFIMCIILLLLLTGPEIERKLHDIGVAMERKLNELRTDISAKVEDSVTKVFSRYPGVKLFLTILTLCVKLAFHIGLLVQRICKFIWPAVMFLISANSRVCRALAMLGASTVSVLDNHFIIRLFQVLYMICTAAQSFNTG